MDSAPIDTLSRLSNSLTYELAKLSPGGVAQGATEPEEAGMTPLLNSLMQEINALRANPSAISLGLDSPGLPSKPMVTATMGGGEFTQRPRS